MTTQQRAWWKRPVVIVTAVVVVSLVALPLAIVVADSVWGGIANIIYG